MYGLVNKAIEDFLTQESGIETWEQSLERSRVPVEVPLSVGIGAWSCGEQRSGNYTPAFQMPEQDGACPSWPFAHFRS